MVSLTLLWLLLVSGSTSAYAFSPLSDEFVQENRGWRSNRNSGTWKRAQPTRDEEPQRFFSKNVRELLDFYSTDSLEMLVHTKQKDQDVLIFTNDTSMKNCTINSEIYANFMIISHLPVTAIAILLPDLLKNNFTLPESFSESSTFIELQSFQNSLSQLNIGIAKEEQNSTADRIIKIVSKFVNGTLQKPSVNNDSINSFVKELEPLLDKAAKFAVEGYFKNLTNILRTDCNESCCIVMSNQSNWTIVIDMQEFSYPGSFLDQYYRSLTSQQFFSPRRIIHVPCNSSLQANASSRAALYSTLSKIFNNNENISPLHSALSEAAMALISPPDPVYRGFSNFEERLYVVVIVALFSTTTVFMIVAISVCCEDKVLKMNRRAVKMKMKVRRKGPSLFFPEKGPRSPYKTYHNLRKKHSKDHSTQEQNSKSFPSLLSSQNDGAKYTRLSEPPGSPNSNTPVSASNFNSNTVTSTDIYLADLTEES